MPLSGIEEWRAWRVRRDRQLRRPYGTLALIGTHWLDEEPAPIVEGEPVLWSAGPHGATVTVTAKAEHGLVLDGEPIDGTVPLYPDTAPLPSVVTAGKYLLVPIEREGVAALRVYDPGAETLKTFGGVDAFEYDPAAAVPAVFTAYEAERGEQVLNTDGRHRGLGLVGTVAFELGGARRELAVGRNADGTLQAVIADATSGKSTFRFRFLTIKAPGPGDGGRTTVDFNRAYLPPCAFADHYACPVPPRGNTLPIPVEAGEKAVRRA